MTVVFKKKITDKEFFLKLCDHIEIKRNHTPLHVEGSSFPLELAAESLRNDKDVVEQSLKLNIGSYKLAPIWKKLDFEYAIKIVNKDPCLFRECFITFRSNINFILVAFNATQDNDIDTLLSIVSGIPSNFFDTRLENLLHCLKDKETKIAVLRSRIPESISNVDKDLINVYGNISSGNTSFFPDLLAPISEL